MEKSDKQRLNRESLEGSVSRLEVLNYDEAAAYQFGQLRHELKGQETGPYDFMIVAHARSLGITLIANNIREFSRVEGLRI